jgi:hypothetical protein
MTARDSVEHAGVPGHHQAVAIRAGRATSARLSPGAQAWCTTSRRRRYGRVRMSDAWSASA